MSFVKQLEQDLSQAFNRLINSRMEQKTTEKQAEKKATFPADYLMRVELLPDGTVTDKPATWLQQWADFTRRQVQNGCIKLYEVPEYDADTGAVPNSFIYSIYLKNRKLN